MFTITPERRPANANLNREHTERYIEAFTVHLPAGELLCSRDAGAPSIEPQIAGLESFAVLAGKWQSVGYLHQDVAVGEQFEARHQQVSSAVVDGLERDSFDQPLEPPGNAIADQDQLIKCGWVGDDGVGA
jgi:hypothetical protein